jgi:hypothetical protein
MIDRGFDLAHWERKRKRIGWMVALVISTYPTQALNDARRMFHAYRRTY